MPIALLTARLLLSHMRLLRRTLSLAVVCCGLLTMLLYLPIDAANGRISYALHVPGQTGYHAIDLFSGKWQADVLNQYVKSDDLIVSYGEYQTSVVYYTGHMVYDLIPASSYAKRTGTDINWQRKYVMPVLTFNQLPHDRDIYLLWDTRHDKKLGKLLNRNEWQVLAEQKHVRIYRRAKDTPAALSGN